MDNYIWWGIEFAPNNDPGYMKMLNGVCQNVYTETGDIPTGNIEYTCVSMDVPAPSWYDPATNQP